jgi:hypothetical protein
VRFGSASHALDHEARFAFKPTQLARHNLIEVPGWRWADRLIVQAFALADVRA